MTTLAQFGEQATEMYIKEGSINSVLGRPGPKKEKTNKASCLCISKTDPIRKQWTFIKRDANYRRSETAMRELEEK
jgi:hypothetical protein